MGHKFSSKHIIIAGAPQFDELARAGKTTKRKKMVMLFTADFSYYISAEKYDQLLDEIVAGIPKEYTIIIKTKGREDSLNRYEQLAKRWNQKRIFVVATSNHKEMYALMQQAAAIITFGSSVVFEAGYLQKPILLLDVLGKRFNDDTWLIMKRDLGLLRAKPSDLPNLLKRLENSKFRDMVIIRQSKSQEKYTGKIDGQAANRIIHYIKRQMRK